MKARRIKVFILAMGCVLVTSTGFVFYKLDKWEILPLRLWRADYTRSTPKGAVFSMRNALVSGDANGYVACFRLETEDELFSRSLKEMVLAFARLRRQLAATYGDVNANVTIRNLAPAVIPEQAIHSAAESKEGGHVQVSIGAKDARLLKLELTRAHGQWQIHPETLFGGMSRPAITTLMAQFVSVIDRTIPEIAKGTYSNADEVRRAIKHEMN